METVTIKRNIRQTEFCSLIGLPIANNFAGIRFDNRSDQESAGNNGAECEEALIIPLRNADNYQFNNSAECAVLCRTPDGVSSEFADYVDAALLAVMN